MEFAQGREGRREREYDARKDDRLEQSVEKRRFPSLKLQTKERSILHSASGRNEKTYDTMTDKLSDPRGDMKHRSGLNTITKDVTQMTKSQQNRRVESSSDWIQCDKVRCVS